MLAVIALVYVFCFRDSTEVWSCDSRKDFFSKTCMFMLLNNLMYKNLLCGNMSSIDLATRFKIGMYLLNREKCCKAFPRSTDIKRDFKKLPTDERHIKVPQDCYALHTSTKTGMPYTRRQQEKSRFSKNSFMCVTQIDLSVVPLRAMQRRHEMPRHPTKCLNPSLNVYMYSYVYDKYTFLLKIKPSSENQFEIKMLFSFLLNG